MRKFKTWVVWLLVLINMISILFMGSDCDSLKLFVIVKIISGSVFILSGWLLLKYGGLNNE